MFPYPNSYVDSISLFLFLYLTLSLIPMLHPSSTPDVDSDSDCAECDVAFLMCVHVDVVDVWLSGCLVDQRTDRLTGWMNGRPDGRSCVMCVGPVYVMGVGVSLRLCGVVIGGKYVFRWLSLCCRCCLTLCVIARLMLSSTHKLCCIRISISVANDISNGFIFSISSLPFSIP